MIELQDITIDSKSIFDDYFSLKEYEISDFTFTNLYMWRKSYNVKFAIVKDFLCIFARYGNHKPFTFIPIGDGDLGDVMEILIEYFEAQQSSIIVKSLTTDMIGEIEKAWPNRFIYEASRDTSDYIYKSSDLISLEGKKYHSKRNHIHKFTSLYDYQYLPLTEELVEECIQAEEEWCIKKNCKENPGIMDEKMAIIDALRHFKQLKYKGGVIKIGGKVVCFTYGERLTKNMAVVHVEKADPDMQGSYTMINQKFCEEEWKNIEFINREEDMGIPGLRKAKLSYNPISMVEKYTAVLKE